MVENSQSPNQWFKEQAKELKKQADNLPEPKEQMPGLEGLIQEMKENNG